MFPSNIGRNYKFITALLLSVLLFWGAFQGYGLSALNGLNVERVKNQYPVLHYSSLDGRSRNQVKFLNYKPTTWASIEDIPDHVWSAMVISEDWAFFSHDGADFLQIWRAFRDFALGRRKLRGASTITQQVAKNVFLSHERSFSRKIKEYFVGKKLEKTLAKKKILELYINIVEWGDGIVGIRQAAMTYFRKSPSQLSPRESAFLAYLLPSPIRYSEVFYDRKMSDYALERVGWILAGMLQAQYIDEGVFQSESNAKFSFEVDQSRAEVKVIDQGDSDFIDATEPSEDVDDSSVTLDDVSLEEAKSGEYLDQIIEENFSEENSLDPSQVGE